LAETLRKTYGRKKGRPLGKERGEVVETLLPLLSVPPERLTEDHTTAPASLFQKPFQAYWLEIGFGTGEHLSTLCERHPDTGFFGAEPFINGVAALLKDLKPPENAPPPANIRLLHGDAMALAHSFTAESLDGIYVLNPDPWPKKRHYSRRIIRPDTLDVFAHILKSGGALIMSTDVDDLAEWMVTQAINHPAFTWTAQSKADWQTMPKDWIPTRYEQKGFAAGRKQTYLHFLRK